MRTSGVLLPVFSLPSPHGIGCFSKEAYEWVDFLKLAGQQYWQILPLGPTSYGDSPYQSFSTYAGNPYFIDLEELVEAGFLTRKEVEACDCGKAARDIDYGKLYENRMPLLKLAYERSLEKPDPKFTAFWTENAWWLDDYGLFMAVKDIFDGNSWDQWAEDIRYRWDNAMWYYKTNYSKEIGFYVWLQYLFFTQWQKLKKYANDKGLKIIGDIPIYVAYDSADVWAHPEMFQLTNTGALEEIVLQGRDMSQFVSDFTWYLRNLLLVKTSGDSCEEVIDISSENLARLKEEAQQIEVDAIMRDIRCFSELSGRIRYAGQKRVLIEMALIRLCRPEMETNEDTLLERIRKLEQTVEQIESGSIAIAAAPTGQPAVQAAAPVRRAELPKAVPEEIKEIVAKWPRVAGSAQQPMKSYLKNARLSLGGDNRLLLVVEDGLASDYFTKEPANKGALEQLLAELTGKQIEVEVRSVRSKQEMESSYVDLTRVIHMDIEEE